MSASTAAKSNACTKPLTIRCGSLSDRASARVTRRDLVGPPLAANLREKDPRPDLENGAKGGDGAV